MTGYQTIASSGCYSGFTAAIEALQNIRLGVAQRFTAAIQALQNIRLCGAARFTAAVRALQNMRLWGGAAVYRCDSSVTEHTSSGW
ncbi:MAG TPA: hypothetical protein VF123_09640, partial [Candidatus Sulfotelmatobacter sp.]